MMVDRTLLLTRYSSSATGETVGIMRPLGRRLSFGLSELWERRNLLFVFVWRDIKVRYKQTALGAMWALLQPLLTMIVFTLVFGRLAKVPSEGIPYPVFVLSGLLPWQFLAHGLSRAAGSLVQERYMLTNLYVPRLVLPVSAVLGGLPDFAIAYACMLGIMLHYKIWPTLTELMVLPLLLLAIAVALCVGLFLCALNVRYRDVNHTIPFLIQLWFFVTPVAYPTSLVSAQWRSLYEVNPMVAVVEGFRWAITGRVAVNSPPIIISAALSGVLLLLGLLYFQRIDRTFADVV